MMMALSKWRLLVIIGIFLGVFSQVALAQTAIRFNLDKSCVTSAAAYRADGTLVRTLWQKVKYGAGAQQATWDGLDDAGQRVAAGSYTIKVVAHNVTYTWEGVVGNTSASWTTNIWRGLVVMQDFCMAPNGETYAALGYNEGLPGLVYNPTGTVQSPRKVVNSDFYDGFSLVRADNAYLYAVTNNSGWDNLESSYVMRFKQSDKSVAPWSNGVLAKYSNHTRNGVISLQQAASPTNNLAIKRDVWLTNRITGLAVNSQYIAVARKAQNKVQFYAVSSGALLGTLTVPSPGQVAFASTGDLWVITAGQVKRFTVDNGKSFSPQNTLPGIVEALALDAHPSQNLLLVADGKTSQQVKAFNAAGALQWTYGRPGGYSAQGPDVTNDKFWFQIQDPLADAARDRDQYGDPYTFVKWQPDGTFWVLDAANLRALHFGANRNYLEQIMYLPDRLVMAGNQTNATRVFSQNLEFEVSTAPLRPGDQSLLSSPTWKLIKNWGAGLDITRYRALINVTTHANGHTYAQIQDNTTNNGSYKGVKTALVELPASGPMRFTGAMLEDFGNGGFSYEQMPNGELVCGRIDADKYNYPGGGDAELRCEKRAITGYDSKFNPQYGPVQIVWTIRTKLHRSTDPFFDKPVGARIRLPRTANGNYVTYQPRKRNIEGTYHLGTVAPGATTWTAKFHRGKAIQRPDGQGSYPEIDAYGGWDGANVYADGKDIVALYNGQNNTASNTFNHYTENGLLVGEFGAPANGSFDENYALPGLAGNNVDMYMVRVSPNTLHAYTVDEAAHAGLHRWRIDGTGDVRDFAGSGKLGGIIQLNQLNNIISAPLPVELTIFNASRNNGTVLCQWETASEKNNDYFIVERSTDGQTYSKIGKVLSVGPTSVQKQVYRYIDAQPPTKVAYYRLRQVDIDGTEKFSPVVTVSAAISVDTPLVASVVPNPGTGLFELLTPGGILVEANIYNSFGRHIRKLIPLQENAQRLPFELTNFSEGVYIMRVQMAEGVTTVRVVKSSQ